MLSSAASFFGGFAMSFRQCLASFCVTACLAGIASAHPGHAIETSDATSLAHYATHPDHQTYWVAALAIILTVRWVMRRTVSRQASLAPVRVPLR